MRWMIAVVLICSITTSRASGQRFEAQTIDDKVQIGYGTAIGDVDGDGKADVLLADKRQFVWYQNPSWKKHVLAENLTEQDNVCIAARDLDGDGKVEIAVGGQWNPGDTVNSGAVFYLIAPEDRTQKWEAVKLPHEPTVHRMHWVSAVAKHERKDRYRLVVSPLHGRGNRNGEGDGARLLAYEMPTDPRQPWKTTVLDDQFHITHNFDPCNWFLKAGGDQILYLGREGALLLPGIGGKLTTQKFPRIEGGGEIRMGLLSPESPYIATIEPFHGDKLVVYLSAFARKPFNRENAVEIRDRLVLDDNFNQGHALATGDFSGSGRQQIVAGWRNKNRDGVVGIKLYSPDEEGTKWDATWIDKDGMATEDLRVGDLDADGRLDIVAAGRDTHNLKIYWNRPVE